MILGIDPGVANIGWAILDDKLGEYKLIDYGCLKTKISDGSGERLNKIYEEIEELIRKYKIKEVAYEKLFFAKNAKSALAVAESIGVIKICTVRSGLEVFGYTPMQVKMALTGYGKAEKEQVEMMVRNLLNLEKIIKPDHASDAVAVGLTHLFTNKNLL